MSGPQIGGRDPATRKLGLMQCTDSVRELAQRWRTTVNGSRKVMR